jgi:hypothetical protein
MKERMMRFTEDEYNTKILYNNLWFLPEWDKLEIAPSKTIELTGIKYDCPDCGKWWISEDDSQELNEHETYCPYCDDYTGSTRRHIVIQVKE